MPICYEKLPVVSAGAGAVLSSGLMKLASFGTVKQFVDTAMQGDPSKTVMSGGQLLIILACTLIWWFHPHTGCYRYV